jgi:PAS domain S-box-containing protein
MKLQLDHPTEEINRLQRCINDLVSVLALPAMWSGGEPSQVVHTLLDALLRMLLLDLVYVQLKDPLAESPVEIVRVSQSLKRMPRPQEICALLNRCLGDDPLKWPALVRNPVGDDDISIVSLPLGLRGEIGVIVAGSQRQDFPQQTERLVLSIAANQAAIALQEARLLNEQKRIANELDRRVAQRTSELAETNQALRDEIAERQRAERALQVRELNLRLIVDSIPAPVAVKTPTGEVESVNQPTLEYFGKTFEDLKKWGTGDAVHPDDLPHAIDVWREAIKTGHPYEIKERLRRFDGVYRWFEVRGFPLQDPNGRILNWCVLLTDINDRQRAEDALRASERDLSLNINAMPTLLASARPDGWGDFFNQRWLDYTGLSAEQLQGWGWATPLHPDDAEGLLKTWRSSLVSGAPLEAEVRMRRFDGTFRWLLFRANALRDESGNIVKWYGTAADIDDRKQVEEKLRRSEAFLAEGQRLSSTGSFSRRVSTDEITFSEEMCRIFELEPPVSLERIASRIHPEDLPVFKENVERSRRWDPREVQSDLRLLLPDGSVKTIQVVAHSNRDESGQLEHIGTAQDVTQRRLSEEALSRARSELAHVARVASLGMLTASIAHELNQPLSGIVTNASTCLRMLGADPANVDGARETARRTIRDGNRASEVITRLRALYSKKDLAPESMDLNEATREVISLSLSDLQRNRVILQLELAVDLPLVTGDRVQLQQVILNLLRNASDAMSNVDDRPRDLLIRTERDEADRVRLTVKDAGMGFTPQAMDRLFESFYTTKKDGMGMGLSLSRAIIENHHGRLWATLNGGPGATFSFSIPQAPEGLARAGIRNLQTPTVTDTDAA